MDLNAPTGPDVTRLLRAAHNLVRLELMFLVGQYGPMNVSEIVEHFRVSRRTIVRHLKVLNEAGAVSLEQKGPEISCSLNGTYVVSALRSLADIIENFCPESRLTN